ncbi:unnamed protein product [Plasmodium vivax]|uniref:(malaria parasite P. vivax) hypothetical protein n=1 Tax=Plasmodium vivax TaxID=5855 RepID=A0A8S4HJA4_PLAVI|nr:unnamed protein product [Plasmodium vivax]
MGCYPTIKDDSYDFFDVIENYINKANDAQYKDTDLQNFSDCDNFSTVQSSFTNSTIAKRTCVEIVKLYKSLNSLKLNLTGANDYKNDSRFFNYWVNFKTSKSMIDESDCIKLIYNAIESQCVDDFNNMGDTTLIYDINKNDLNKMNILYSLYDNYTKLKAIEYKNAEQDKQQLLSLSTACCTDYIKASYMCNEENINNNRKFCEKLTAFQSKYDKLYEEAVRKGSDYSKNFIRLSECGNNKIITTAATGSIVGLIPLFGILYKFTPMGQMFRSKKGILNNDEEMTKISSTEHDNEPLRFQQGSYNIKYESL